MPTRKARGNHHAIVFGLAVDVFHPINALDDGFQRLGDEFNRIGSAQSVRIDADVDHRNTDLWLFLTRDDDDGDQADDQRGEQKQRRQRRTDGRPGEPPGQTEIHGCTN